jgi:hypothetical protein
MRRIGYGFLIFLFWASALFLVNCGGSGGGSSSGTGTLSMNVTDAKPALPVDDIEQVLITIDEIRVHKSGGGWTQLELANGDPEYQLDLLQYHDGDTTALVLPIDLSSGRYTQIRFGVKEAYMVSTSLGNIPLEIPSEYLKTDKNFEFDLPTRGSVAITIDFDLSQSIVATGSGTYQFKPVLHVVKAPTSIEGSILETRAFTDAEIVVTWDKDNDGQVDSYPVDEEYTRLIVTKANSGPTPFKIYFVVPNTKYIVQIFINNAIVYEEIIEASELPEGTAYELNLGNPI